MALTDESRIRKTWGDGFGVFASRCLQVLIVLTLAAAVVIAGITLKTLVIAALLAVILACAFTPLTNLLARVIPRTLAALLTLLIILGALGGLLTLVGFAVARQSNELVKAAKHAVVQVEQYLQQLGLPVDSSSLQKAIDAGRDYVTSASFGHSAIDGLSVAGEIAAGTVLLLFVLFFLLRDGAKVWAFLTQVFKGENRARAARIGTAGATVLGAYARGTALIAAIDAIVIGIALLILHVPLALPLAVLVFITAFIPIIGAPLGGALATAVALVSNGPVTALIVVILLVAIHLSESHLLQPLIMGRAVSLHPLVVLLAITAGTILGGIVGAILAVPTASVVWAAIKAWEGPKPAVVETAPEVATTSTAPKKRRRSILGRH